MAPSWPDYETCAVNVRNAKLRNYLKFVGNMFIATRVLSSFLYYTVIKPQLSATVYISDLTS